MAFDGADKRLLYFITSAQGGLSRYAREQIPALRQMGLTIDLLSPEEVAKDLAWDGAHLAIQDLAAPRPGWSRTISRLVLAERIVANHRRLAQRIAQTGCRHVLISAFAEYVAPLWIGALRKHQRQGCVFGAILHDPIRDLRVGPAWWHDRSVAAAAGLLREGFVHGDLSAACQATYPDVRLTSIPLGPNLLPPPRRSRAETRGSMGIPAGSYVLLAFGYIRDNKNLDLVLRAMPSIPDAILVVAGGEQSATQRPLSYYMDLAARLGIHDRCRFTGRTVSQEESSELFEAADLILVTYSRSFVSASAVMAQAASHSRPCLASSGPGPLVELVERHGLGQTIKPDDRDAIIQGIAHWRAKATVPDYAAFLRANSWERNAEIVAERLFSDP